MTQEELNIIIDKHQKWLNEEPGGEQADLYCEDLHELNLQGANLRLAKMYGVVLRSANLSRANFSLADLREADLCLCNMYQTYLEATDLKGANLRGSNLKEAHLKNVSFGNANLLNTKLSGAYDLPYIPTSCPEYGDFTAWKRAQDKIVKLLIPADAQRSSATTRKCRSDKAKVLGIYDMDGNLLPDVKEVASDWTPDFVYKVNETVYPDDFDEDRWNECSGGIHFFTGFNEAVLYE